MAISETNGVITYSEHLPVWVRMFIGIIGAVMAVVGPATMLSMTIEPWSVSFVLSVVTGVASLVFGLLALAVSFGSQTTLEFRPSERLLVVSKRGPFARGRVEYKFSAVNGPSFTMRDSEDGAYPVLGLGLSGRKYPLEMVGFANADEARLWQKRIADMLAASA